MGCLIVVLILAGLLTLPSIIGPLIFWSLAGVLAVQDKNNQRQAQQLQQQAKQHRELLKAVNPQAYQELVEKEAAEAARVEQQRESSRQQARASDRRFLFNVAGAGTIFLFLLSLGTIIFLCLATLIPNPKKVSTPDTTFAESRTEPTAPEPTSEEVRGPIAIKATPTPEPTFAEVRGPIPIKATPTPRSAQLDLQGAEEDLNRAWKALTTEQRSHLREDEQNWDKRKDALPLEDRIKSTQQRAKHLWSLVERTFDD